MVQNVWIADMNINHAVSIQYSQQSIGPTQQQLDKNAEPKFWFCKCQL